MKILFYDGILTDFICKHRDIKELEPPFTTLDAGDGPTKVEFIEWFKSETSSKWTAKFHYRNLG